MGDNEALGQAGAVEDSDGAGYNNATVHWTLAGPVEGFPRRHPFGASESGSGADFRGIEARKRRIEFGFRPRRRFGFFHREAIG